MPMQSKINTDLFKGFVDETIRDGLQYVGCINTSFQCKKAAISYMKNVKYITDVILGMIGISEDSDYKLRLLAEECKLSFLKPWVLCRINENDIRKFENLHMEYNNVGLNLFIATSSIRMDAEGWDENYIIELLNRTLLRINEKEWDIRIALEDTTRTDFTFLSEVIELLMKHNVKRIALCDTVGVALPKQVRKIFSLINGIKKKNATSKVEFEWHGHNDRGIAVANSLEAIECGANYVHGTMLGIGERAGNANLDILIPNVYPNDKSELECLKLYYTYCIENIGKTDMHMYPFWGDMCCKSSTGTHCAAIAKAYYQGKKEVMENVFPKGIMNVQCVIDNFLISSISGLNMVRFIFDYYNEEYNIVKLSRVLTYVKEQNLILEPHEFIELYRLSD